MVWRRTGTNDYEQRLRRIEQAEIGAAREELHALDTRLRQLESTATILMNHVKTCEALGMQAARERAMLRRELRAFALTIMAAIIASYFGAHGIHLAF